MAVGSSTYGTVARVEARVGDVVEGRKFAGSTVPSLPQVEMILDDVAARINSELLVNGYTVPVSSTDDPHPYAWLQGANSAGAAAIVLNMLPGEALDPDIPDPIRVRRQGLWAELDAVLKAIREGRFPATRTATARMTPAFAGSQEDADGEVKKPVFTRDLTDYPGIWGLKE